MRFFRAEEGLSGQTAMTWVLEKGHPTRPAPGSATDNLTPWHTFRVQVETRLYCHGQCALLFLFSYRVQLPRDLALYSGQTGRDLAGNHFPFSEIPVDMMSLQSPLHPRRIYPCSSLNDLPYSGKLLKDQEDASEVRACHAM